MRLIDADELMTVTDVQEDGTEVTYVPYSEIEDAPTAYDPDKVVKQLKEIRPEEDCFDNAEEYKHALSRHNKIIEIVEGGGVDGN